MIGKVLMLVADKLKESNENTKKEINDIVSDVKNDLSDVDENKVESAEEKAKVENSDYKKEV